MDRTWSIIERLAPTEPNSGPREWEAEPRAICAELQAHNITCTEKDLVEDVTSNKVPSGFPYVVAMAANGRLVFTPRS